MLHCIGDSHSLLFMGCLRPVHGYHNAGGMHPVPGILDHDGESPVNGPFMVHWLGQRTAYNLCRRKTVVDEVLRRFWKEGDRVMFVAGEIDCREHLPKQSEKREKPIEDVAKECMDRYFGFISGYRQYGLVVYFVVPTTMARAECRLATFECNKRLSELAKSEGLPFVGIQDEIVSNDIRWYHDGTHLDPKLALPLITEKMKGLGLIP